MLGVEKARHVVSNPLEIYKTPRVSFFHQLLFHFLKVAWLTIIARICSKWKFPISWCSSRGVKLFKCDVAHFSFGDLTGKSTHLNKSGKRRNLRQSNGGHAAGAIRHTYFRSKVHTCNSTVCKMSHYVWYMISITFLECYSPKPENRADRLEITYNKLK